MRNYFIGENLATTSNVFERARIELIYSFTMLYLLLVLLFLCGTFNTTYTWQFYVTLMGLSLLPFILIVLKTTRNTTYAGYVFFGINIIMNCFHEVIVNFDRTTEDILWIVAGILFVFFVLGKTAGFIVLIWNILELVFGIVNKQLDYAWFKIDIPPEQIMPLNPAGTIIGMGLIGFILYKYSRTRKEAERLIAQQNAALAVKNAEILSSISYAQRIQNAILPSSDRVREQVGESFVLYQPKEAVSGDFYGVERIGDNSIFYVADCTGHGVPGAMLSVMCSNLLQKVIGEMGLSDPAEILTQTSNLLETQLGGTNNTIQDGMDLALCCLDVRKKRLTFAGANNSVYLISNGKLTEFKATKRPIGNFSSAQDFASVEISFQSGDCLYLFSDGFADQFGGDRGKKFLYKNFKEMLLDCHAKPMDEQRQILLETFTNWKGSLEQIDDVCVMGIRL